MKILKGDFRYLGRRKLHRLDLSRVCTLAPALATTISGQTPLIFGMQGIQNLGAFALWMCSKPYNGWLETRHLGPIQLDTPGSNWLYGSRLGS